jgi:hypothetical protein
MSKKVDYLSSSLSAVDHLRVDVDEGSLKFFTLPEMPTGIFNHKYADKCYTFAAAVSGNDVNDYLVVLALRPDWGNGGGGKVIDIDTAAFCFESNSLTSAPSGAALFHQNFDGRTMPVSGFDEFTLESTVDYLHSTLIPGSTPLSATPPHYLNAISHSIKKFNELLPKQVSALTGEAEPDVVLDEEVELKEVEE